MESSIRQKIDNYHDSKPFTKSTTQFDVFNSIKRMNEIKVCKRYLKKEGKISKFSS
jgi:hypothetical protein